ncbi:MAG: hypothetical protein ACK6DS_02320 [Planctomycetota bacterium]
MKTRLLFAMIALVAFTSSGWAQLSSAVKNAPLQPGNLAAALASTARKTTFDPTKHGFKFSNTFNTELVMQDIRLGGLCGGMVYTSLDYFHARKRIPSQTFRPPVKSPLFDNIYQRQESSLVNNLDKWTELVVNPFGARTGEFFRWGLQGTNGGRLEELRREIDAGRPCPLGLFVAGNGGFASHHQVLAIGYDLGRYKGDLGEHQGDLKIFVYDPNFPNQTMTLVPKVDRTSYEYLEDSNCKWMTYFVDRKYSPARPTNIATPDFPNDGLVHQLQCEFRTGGDDLRGGNDNCNVTIFYKDGTSERHENINRGGRWIGNYCETVTIDLRRPCRPQDLDRLEVQTTFGGGLSGDNWNVDGLYIVAIIGGGRSRTMFEESGAPLVRFDGNNRPLKAALR